MGNTTNSYTGKELQSEFGLNWTDHHARFFDPALGRWHVQDPLRQYSNPYLAMGNCPVMRIDLNGGEDGLFGAPNGGGDSDGFIPGGSYGNDGFSSPDGSNGLYGVDDNNLLPAAYCYGTRPEPGDLTFGFKRSPPPGYGVSRDCSWIPQWQCIDMPLPGPKNKLPRIDVRSLEGYKPRSDVNREMQNLQSSNFLQSTLDFWNNYGEALEADGNVGAPVDPVAGGDGLTGKDWWDGINVAMGLHFTSANIIYTSRLNALSRHRPLVFTSGRTLSGGSSLWRSSLRSSMNARIGGGIMLGAGILYDGLVGIPRYYDQGPNDPWAVSPTQAAINAGVATYSFFFNPLVAPLYFGLEGFYPGGFNGAMDDYGRITTTFYEITGEPLIPYNGMR